LSFRLARPTLIFIKYVLFSSYLDGWDKSWSAWKTTSTREFSRLSYGDYTLRVKAKCMSLEGPETLIKIHIPAPWYWTALAKVLYSILALLAVLVTGFYPKCW
jgi:hypothetical protein